MHTVPPGTLNVGAKLHPFAPGTANESGRVQVNFAATTGIANDRPEMRPTINAAYAGGVMFATVDGLPPTVVGSRGFGCLELFFLG